MNDNVKKTAAFYDQMGRDLFHKFAQDINASSEGDSDTEFGTGGKLKLTSLLKKFMSKKAPK